jgi:DNA polymerase III subunit epsilon
MKDKFLAFDVETANSELSSLCQIGYVFVEDGVFVEQNSYLVQPPKNNFFHINSCLHGIDALKTKDAPTFPEIWTKVDQLFYSNLIIAHNSSFDVAVLKTTLKYYNLPIPDFNHECTYKMSGLKLSALCESLEIELVKHHDALSDAIACAQAYIMLKRGIIPNHSLIKESLFNNIYAGHERIRGDLLKPNLEIEDKVNPFYGKKVVFTGVLDKISREEAAISVKSKGADIDSCVTRKTHYVIAGSGAGPSKLKKIAEFNSNGSCIQIINEDEFLQMIKS